MISHYFNEGEKEEMMKRKFFKGVILCFIILLAAAAYFSIIKADDKLTGGEFATKLVESIGLGYKLPPDATTNDYVNLLKDEGFTLPQNFDPSKPITSEQKANLLSQILNLKDAEKEKAQLEIYRNKAVIKKLEGKVTVKREGTDTWIPAELNMKLIEGDYVKTGPNSAAFLRVGVAGRIEVEANSELQLRNLATQANRKSENILLYLAMGDMTVDVRFIDKNTSFETHTPTTITAVRGTIYKVSVSPTEGKTEIR